MKTEQGQRVAQQASIDQSGGDLLEAGGGRCAIDQGHAIKQGGRADRADDQVLEAGLERLAATEVGAAERVKRDREQLQRDKEGHQIVRHGQHHHAERRSHQQGQEVGSAGLLAGGIALGEQDRGRGCSQDQQRENHSEAVNPQ